MKLGIKGVVPEAVVSLRERVASWRRDKKGRRMPEALWTEAVAMAREYGVYSISQNAVVSYSRLKKLVDASQVKAPSELPKFIEVSQVAARKSGGVQIELRRPDGCEMIIKDADVVCTTEAVAGFLGLRR